MKQEQQKHEIRKIENDLITVQQDEEVQADGFYRDFPNQRPDEKTTTNRPGDDGGTTPGSGGGKLIHVANVDGSG